MVALGVFSDSFGLLFLAFWISGCRRIFVAQPENLNEGLTMKRQERRGSLKNTPSAKAGSSPIMEEPPVPQSSIFTEEFWQIRDLVRFRIDLSLRFHFLDAGFAQLTGFEASDLLNNSPGLLQIVHEQDRQALRDAVNQSARDDDYFSTRFRIITRTGTDKWLWMRGPVEKNLHSDLYFIKGVLSDISEQKEIENALQIEREFFHAFADTLDDGICVISKDYRIMYMNKALVSMVGDHTGKICHEALHNREGCCSLPGSTGGDGEKDCGFRELGNRKGSPRVFQVRSLPIVSPTGFQGRIGQFRDISKFKRLQHKFKGFALRVRAIAKAADMADLGILIVVDFPDREAHFRFANRAFCRIIGYSFEELLAMSLFQVIHPEDMPAIMDRYRRQLNGETMGDTYEIRLVRKNGVPITVFFTGALSTHQGRVATVGFVRDITARKQLQESFYLSQRLASIGKLAAEIAHEINNPLTSVLTFNKLIEKIVRQKPFPVERIPELQDYVNFVNAEAGRCTEIARNLLNFSRSSEIHTRQNDLHDILEKTLGILRHCAEINNIEIKMNYGSDIPLIQCDFSRIQQAIMNILWNAIEAMPNGGTLTVSTSFEAQPLCSELCKAGKNMIQVTITDSGAGIARDDLGFVFEPFFSTKKEKSGVGLGLSVAYGIIRQHNGMIQVQSELGRGTSFMIQFPTDICVTCPFSVY
jgi:PAS domain S-box-containing protein